MRRGKIQVNGTAESEIAILTWLVILCFCTWGGMVRYLMGMKRTRQKWNPLAACCQVVISGFTGLIGCLIGLEYGYSLYKVFIVAGVFSTLGSSVLIILWGRIFPELRKDK